MDMCITNYCIQLLSVFEKKANTLIPNKFLFLASFTQFQELYQIRFPTQKYRNELLLLFSN